jgi:hypothetical protein
MLPIQSDPGYFNIDLPTRMSMHFAGGYPNAGGAQATGTIDASPIFLRRMIDCPKR